MSTTGLNVGVHYCSDMFVGVIVNGVSVTTNDVQGMENCMDDINVAIAKPFTTNIKLFLSLCKVNRCTLRL